MASHERRFKKKRCPVDIHRDTYFSDILSCHHFFTAIQLSKISHDPPWTITTKFIDICRFPLDRLALRTATNALMFDRILTLGELNSRKERPLSRSAYGCSEEGGSIVEMATGCSAIKRLLSCLMYLDYEFHDTQHSEKIKRQFPSHGIGASLVNPVLTFQTNLSLKK